MAREMPTAALLLSLLTGAALATEAAPPAPQADAAAPASVPAGPLTPAPMDALLPVLDAELARSQAELSLPDAPTLYHLRYHLALRDTTEAAAAYGALLVENHRPGSELAVEVRVGGPGFDNTGYSGATGGFVHRGIPAGLTPEALSLAAWRATDSAYKDAVSAYATKAAELTQAPDHPGDFQLLGPQRSDHREVPALDAARLTELAVRMSALIPPAAGFERAEVRTYQQSGLVATLDSEGTRALRPSSEAGLRAVAFARCEDGALLSDHRSWFVRSAADLPDEADMAAAIEDMVVRLSALTSATPLKDEYVGPVVFEDDAAVELFRYLLVDQLEGTPPDASSTGGAGIFGSLGGSGGRVRQERRVLPPGWSVVDDPQQIPGHVASFEVDDEGTPAQRVELVADGIVRQLLMSRIPRKGLGTNGHARATFELRAAGRAMMMTVTPDRHLSRARLYRKAMRLARAYDRDFVLVVRRLQDPPVRGYADFASRVSLMVGDDGASTLPAPIYVVKRYKDGREEPLRGAAFAAVTRFALRDIVAAGPQREQTYLAPLYPGVQHIGLTDGFPTWLSAPEVLVGELELVPTSGDPKDRSVLPVPR